MQQPRPTKHRSDVHLARKLWHFSGVMLIFMIYQRVTPIVAQQLITFVAAIGIILDILRLQIPALNRALIKAFMPFMREHEHHRFAGTTYLLLGASIIIWIFPTEITSLVLLFVGIADPLASYFGIRFGRDRLIGKKTLQGTIAAFATCTLIATFYFFTMNIMTERLLIVSLLAGFIGAISELIPIFNLDDNLVFPLLSSILLYGLFFVFGGF